MYKQLEGVKYKAHGFLKLVHVKSSAFLTELNAREMRRGDSQMKMKGCSSSHLGMQIGGF